MFDTIQASGLNEPPAPLSVHFTIPIIFDDAVVVSVIVAVNVTWVPEDNVVGFGVTVVVVA